MKRLLSRVALAGVLVLLGATGAFWLGRLASTPDADPTGPSPRVGAGNVERGSTNIGTNRGEPP